MTLIRNYWVEYGIVGVAVVAMLIGIAHRTSRSMPSVAESRRGSDLLARASLNRLAGKTAFSIDTVSSGGVSRTFGGMRRIASSVHRGDPIVVTGWAVDAIGQAPASKVMLLIDGNGRVDAQYGGSRPDVARAYGVPAFVGSAFNVSFPTNKLGVGRHDLSLLIFDSKQTGFYEERNQIALSVR